MGVSSFVTFGNFVVNLGNFLLGLWDDTVRDAKRISDVPWLFLRQNKGRQGRLQVVVREQLGPQLGNKAIMVRVICKGSVRLIW